MSKKTIEVDSDMIDQAVNELSELKLRLDSNPKKSRKELNNIKKIQEIRDTIQDSVLYAKLEEHTVKIILFTGNSSQKLVDRHGSDNVRIFPNRKFN